MERGDAELKDLLKPSRPISKTRASKIIVTVDVASLSIRSEKLEKENSPDVFSILGLNP
jgi:hypothetical protein